jgi:hypothetical protein
MGIFFTDILALKRELLEDVQYGQSVRMQ